MTSGRLYRVGAPCSIHTHKKTHRTDTNTDKPDGKPVLCQRTFSSVFRAVFYTVKLHSLTRVYGALKGRQILVIARSNAWVCSRSLFEVTGSNPAGAWMSVVSVVCYQVEVTESGWSLVQRSPTECGVS